MNEGDILIYRPAEGGIFQGICKGITEGGKIRIQLTHGDEQPLTNPRFAITSPNRVSLLPVHQNGNPEGEVGTGQEVL